jgi:hypothetical protein
LDPDTEPSLKSNTVTVPWQGYDTVPVPAAETPVRRKYLHRYRYLGGDGKAVTEVRERILHCLMAGSNGLRGLLK